MIRKESIVNIFVGVAIAFKSISIISQTMFFLKGNILKFSGLELLQPTIDINMTTKNKNVFLILLLFIVEIMHNT